MFVVNNMELFAENSELYATVQDIARTYISPYQI
jgi:hypothetical protein